MQVTLFEGGRVSGTEPMGSLISELQVSHLDLCSARVALLMDMATFCPALEALRDLWFFAAAGGERGADGHV